MGRRLMYLWTLLQKSDKELARQVYNTQKLFPVKKDWVLQVQDDLEKCQINHSDDEISKLKKRKFKSIVLKSIHELTTDYLTKWIDKHSKSENLYPSDTMQN